MSTTFFIPSVKTTPLRTGGALVPRQRRVCSARRPSHMSASNGKAPNGEDSQRPPDDGNRNDDNTTFGRFREFTSTPGNRRMQDDLVREVMWQSLRLSTSESFESTIQSHLDAASELLADMYTRSERDIVERNEELTLRTSLPNISKWNQQLIAGHKNSKMQKMEISKELAQVDALLRRARRKKSTGRRLRTRARRQSGGNNMPQGSDAASAIVWSPPMSPFSSAGAIAFTTLVSAFLIESFETISSREGGAARLGNYASFATLIILSLAYLHELQAAARKAEEELDRESGRLYRKDGRHRF